MFAWENDELSHAVGAGSEGWPASGQLASRAQQVDS